MTEGDIIPFPRPCKPQPVERTEPIPVDQLLEYQPGQFVDLINEVAYLWSAKRRAAVNERLKALTAAEVISFPPKPPG